MLLFLIADGYIFYLTLCSRPIKWKTNIYYLLRTFTDAISVDTPLISADKSVFTAEAAVSACVLATLSNDPTTSCVIEYKLFHVMMFDRNCSDFSRFAHVFRDF